jgi:hypothetical protein
MAIHHGGVPLIAFNKIAKEGVVVETHNGKSPIVAQSDEAVFKLPILEVGNGMKITSKFYASEFKRFGQTGGTDPPTIWIRVTPNVGDSSRVQFCDIKRRRDRDAEFVGNPDLIYFAPSQFLNGGLDAGSETEILKGNCHESECPEPQACFGLSPP